LGAVSKIIKLKNETALISPQIKGRWGWKGNTLEDGFLLRQRKKILIKVICSQKGLSAT
jgi:hypothetical protein